MRLSRFPLVTLKEVPASAEIVSHRLMLRAGLVRQLASGLYSWLPLGWRVVRRVERIVREEMDRAGALEMIMPGVQPAEPARAIISRISLARSTATTSGAQLPTNSERAARS